MTEHEYTLTSLERTPKTSIDLGDALPDVARLLAAMFANLTNEDAIKTINDEIAKWEQVVLAKSGLTIVGFGVLRALKKEMNLAFAAVDVNHQKQGIYTRMLDARIEKAKQVGARKLMIQPNRRLIPLLTRYGFKKDGKYQNVMRKSLY